MGMTYDTTPETRRVMVTIEPYGAWEQWIVEVPVDADADWITENLGSCDFIGLDESGNTGSTVVDVEEL